MKGLLFRISLVLVFLSFVPWILIPTLPWWPMSKAFRVAAVPVLLVGAEVIFWLGVALGGAEVLRHRRALGVFFRRRLGPKARLALHLRAKKKTQPKPKPSPL